MDDLWAIIVDDGRSERFYDLVFDEDAERRAAMGLEGRLRRLGVVRETPQAGRAAVLEALRPGGFVPELIILDNVLRTSHLDSTPVRAAHDLCGYVRDQFAARKRPMPACVLWTAEYSANLAHAFRERGGRHAFPHTTPHAEVTAALWRIAHEGETWTPTPPHPEFELTELERELLPFLAADWSNPQIVAALRGLDRQITEGTIRERRRRLRAKVNAWLQKHDEAPIEGTNAGLSLTDVAQRAGHVWVPLGLAQ